MKTLFKLTLILILIFFYSCEKEENIETIDTNGDDSSIKETIKKASKCEVTVKNLASHTRVIYRASDNATTIRVNEWRNGKALIIKTSSGICKIPKPYNELIIYGGKGNDSIIIHSSVKTPIMVYPGDGLDFVRNISNTSVTFVTLGDGKDKIVGNKKNTRFWIDPEDKHNASSTEIDAGKLHVVASFENFDKILDSPDIEDPYRYDLYANSEVPWDYIPMSETSLWGIDLPSPFDVQQGYLQTCNETSRWAALASQQPQKVRELAVELGDNTYAVKIRNNRYVRVDEDIIPFNLSRPGITGKSWYVLLEKAYSDYDKPLAPYDPSHLIATLHCSEYTAIDYLRAIKEFKDQGYTLETLSLYTSENLEIGISRSHVHTILGVENDKIILRNPYGDVFDALRKRVYNANNGRVKLSFEEFKEYFPWIVVGKAVWE